VDCGKSVRSRGGFRSTGWLTGGAQQNNAVWAALQPALQLATRILNANHPAWETITNLYTRRRIDRCWDPRSDAQIARSPRSVHRYAMWPGPPDPDALIPELRRLWDMGFDFKAATEAFLQDRLRFLIGHARTNHMGEESAAASGWTGIREQGPNRILQNMTFRVQISAEEVWPLLSSAFTAGEKAMVSFAVANTILHELGVRPPFPSEEMSG